MKIINETELMANQKASTVIVPDKQFEALQTIEGKALVFSIGTDGILYCTREVPGDTHGWVRVDLSSALSATCYGGAAITAETFDIAQDMTINTNSVDIALVVSCNGTYYLHLVTGFTNTFDNWNSGAPVFTADSQFKFDYPGDNISTYQAMPINDIQIVDSNDGNAMQYIIVDLVSNATTQTISRFYVDTTKQRGYAWLPHDLSSDLQAGKITTFVGCGPNDGPDSYPGAGDSAGNNIGGAYVLGSVAGKPQLQYTPAYNFNHPEETPDPTVFNFPAGTNAAYMAMDVSSSAADAPYTDFFFASNGQLYFLACADQNDSGTSKPTPVSIYTHDLFQNIQSLHVKNWNDNIVIWGQSLDPADMQTARLFIMEGVAGQETNAAAWSCPIPLLFNVVNSSAYVNNKHSSDSLIDPTNGNAYGSCSVLYAEQVAKNDDGNYTSVLTQLFQDPVTSAWQERSLLTAPDTEHILTEIYDTTTYSTHIEITDDYNVVHPNVPVALWASSPCSVYINDAKNTDAYFTLDTQKPWLLQTDITGNVTIMQPVDTIGGISYYVAIQDPVTKQIYTEAINPMTNTVSRINSKVPDGSTDYIASAKVTNEDGSQSQLITGSFDSKTTTNTSNNINTICQQNEHMNADGLVTGQSWPDATTVATAFSTVQSVAAQPAVVAAVNPVATARVKRIGLPAAKNRVKNFARADRQFKDLRFDRTTDKIWGWTYGKNAAHYEGIDAIKEMGVMLNSDGSLSLTPASTMLGSGLHFEANIGHIVKWMKSEGNKLEKAVVTFANGVVDCVLTIAGDFYHFIAKCANDIVNLVHTVLNAIEAAFADIIKWIGFIFEYKDILNTHNVIKNIMQQYLAYCVTNLGSLKGNIQSVFTTLEDDLNKLVGLPPITDTPQSTSANNPAPSSTKTPQANWGTHKLKSNGGNASAGTWTPPDTGDDPTNGLLSVVNDTIQGEKDAMNNLQTQIKSVIDNFQTLTVSQIVEQILVIITDFLLNQTEIILTDVADVLVSLATTVVDTFNAPIDIPVISWLYKKISGGNDFSIVDLMCLVVAIPATIVYKVIENESPFPDSDATTAQLISAPDFETIVTILTTPIVTAVGDHSGGTDSGHTNTRMDTAVKVGNILGGVGSVAVDVCVILKSGAADGLKDNKWINLANSTSYLAYVFPDILSLIPTFDKPGENWTVYFNNMCTYYAVVKAGIDGVGGFGFKWSEIWGLMSPWIDFVLNIAWQAPTFGVFFNAREQFGHGTNNTAFEVVNLVGGTAFDLSGICSPWLWGAQEAYDDEPNPATLAALGVMLALVCGFNLAWGASCVLGSFGPWQPPS
ncbi:hypothetical protein [Flavitalea sp.]|nr:hypothetical protein [Flavitalea sp.]